MAASVTRQITGDHGNVGRYKDNSQMSEQEIPFWRRKLLTEMTNSEWERICGGCGCCCLVKLEDADDSSRTHFTDVGCRLLDSEACRCRDYSNRTAKVNDCVRLTHRNINRIVWLPPSCAYRLLADGRDLYWCHPLVSGDPETGAPPPAPPSQNHPRSPAPPPRGSLPPPPPTPNTLVHSL